MRCPFALLCVICMTLMMSVTGQDTKSYDFCVDTSTYHHGGDVAAKMAEDSVGHQADCIVWCLQNYQMANFWQFVHQYNNTSNKCFCKREEEIQTKVAITGSDDSISAGKLKPGNTSGSACEMTISIALHTGFFRHSGPGDHPSGLNAWPGCVSHLSFWHSTTLLTEEILTDSPGWCSWHCKQTVAAVFWVWEGDTHKCNCMSHMLNQAGLDVLEHPGDTSSDKQGGKIELCLGAWSACVDKTLWYPGTLQDGVVVLELNSGSMAHCSKQCHSLSNVMTINYWQLLPSTEKCYCKYIENAGAPVNYATQNIEVRGSYVSCNPDDA